MKFFKKTKYIVVLLLIILEQLAVMPVPKAYAATTHVDLLTTDNFAVLAGSAISDSVTTSHISGDVGLSPTGGASITGLTCSEVSGTIYDNDGGYTGNGGGSTACRATDPSRLTTAQNDLTTAFNDASSRSVTSTISTDLAGALLTDGVYHAASDTFSITGGGTLTLDGQGNADSVFIFKMGSTLDTSSASKVVLINGAQACNVYWEVGSAATLGTGTTFVGNILASSAITDNGGSTVNGRLLVTSAGAVTLSNTTVTKQTCSSSGSNTSSSGGVGGSSAPVCPTIPSSVVSPIVIDSTRISPTSISLNWGPFSGINTFTVRFGLTNGNWAYNTNVTGFSTTLNDLPANQPIWVSVAANNGCSVGSFGESKLVGGSAASGTNSTNVLGVSLPNAGYAPKSSFPRQLPASIFARISDIFALFH